MNEIAGIAVQHQKAERSTAASARQTSPKVQLAPPSERRYLNVPRPGDLLSEQHFMKQLHLEMRRTDRSKTPLSLALFRIDEDRHGAEEVRKFARLLLANKRETDNLGSLSDGRLALLLPDTSKQGVEAVARNVVERSEEMVLYIALATYPDHIFESLLAGTAVPPDSHPFLLDGTTNQGWFWRFLKRSIDYFGALLLMLVASPLMAVTAIAIATTSRGPVIFKQARLGRKGVPFTFYKFRSMSVGADDSIHREFVSSLIEGKHEAINEGDSENPHYKIKADPRVTRVGEIIRPTSIDELPQLFNVLKGDMSLVGPRPPLPYEVARYQSWHLRRVLEIRPGITGLWQVEGRSKTTFDEMVRLDLRYIRTWSPLLDLKILVKTVKVVILRKGAT